MDYQMSHLQIMRALKDPEWFVREAVILRPDVPLSPDIIHNAITDSMPQIRARIAGRLDWDPTEDQVKTGLNDESDLARLAWRNRLGR
ncbi:hypothetical protein BW247_05570 [Acidihalobacter ferrooxydans]|uniref:Uncharacterized protein n=2 Tax=Acidihalobacter ferrooxydans TaxID=1765967 RepID=A0A1P8UFL0_9GAMM|nr:hypothetical protein BW247_05570 [Acidihalobacter ferrooxydans]